MLEFDKNGRIDCMVVISLRHFMRTEGSLTTRTMRNNFVSLKNQAFFIDFFQRPPYRLNIGIGTSDIGLTQIEPVSNSFGVFIPILFVGKYAFFAFCHKFSNSIFFNVLFSADFESFFYLKLNRESMGIPSCFARDMISFHGFIPAK